jgi:hypothetical protein
LHSILNAAEGLGKQQLVGRRTDEMAKPAALPAGSGFAGSPAAVGKNRNWVSLLSKDAVQQHPHIIWRRITLFH